jgi:hypothetical protein
MGLSVCNGVMRYVKTSVKFAISKPPVNHLLCNVIYVIN